MELENLSSKKKWNGRFSLASVKFVLGDSRIVSIDRQPRCFFLMFIGKSNVIIIKFCWTECKTTYCMSKTTCPFFVNSDLLYEAGQDTWTNSKVEKKKEAL